MNSNQCMYIMIGEKKFTGEVVGGLEINIVQGTFLIEKHPLVFQWENFIPYDEYHHHLGGAPPTSQLGGAYS